MKAKRRQNEVKLTASKPDRDNHKQTEEITYETALTALVQYMKFNIDNVGWPLI